MKEKTKKILAGIGVGLTLGTAGAFMTGCSSDITFNQKDLDQAISNINEYLETQNNYSSEFARNTLNGYLMNALNDSARKNIEITYEYNGHFRKAQFSTITDRKFWKDTWIKYKTVEMQFPT